jgi:2-C-methyl-D-erythritol 2,4-cyclodiphosphate synthase
VLCHALLDALAGALVEGDLGRFFPADDDPAARGARSLDYVRRMGAHVAVTNASTWATARPRPLGTTRLGPHLDAMRGALADALGADVAHVSVKARTNDGPGPEGEGRAVAATVVVLVGARDGA